MIRAMMTERCTHLLRGDQPDARGEFEYTPQAPELPCWFVAQEGRVVRDNAGKEVVISGELYLCIDVAADDRLVLNGYEYEIVNVMPLKDALTGKAQCFRYRVVKRRPYDEEPVTIS